jgi:hypothetical protein
MLQADATVLRLRLLQAKAKAAVGQREDEAAVAGGR